MDATPMLIYSCGCLAFPAKLMTYDGVFVAVLLIVMAALFFSSMA